MDVVFEIAGGRVFDESIEALAPFGRIVVNGIATREQNEVRTGRAHAEELVGRRLLADALPRPARR